MAGHSKWSKVKRFKGAIDAKRGKIFSKLSKEITIAAKSGGGDPNGNPRLRGAILAARGQSMPNDNVERAIKRGTGEGRDGEQLEELVYEGYAPGGVAIIVETATDNKNRTGAEIRRIFTQNNGNLASSGSVSYMFRRKGQITVPRLSIDEDRLLEIALEAGAEELTTEEDQYVIITSHDQLYAVAEALKKAGVSTEATALGLIILKNHQIHRQRTPITPAPMSPSRRSISPSERPLRALAKPASRFKPNRNSVRVSSKFPVKGLASCAIRNAILCRR